MTSRLYKRACSLTVYRTAPVTTGFIGANPQFFAPQPNGVQITGLRVQFKIEKSLDSTPNKSEITVSNCAETTRAFLQSKPLIAQLDAGYDGNLRHVFSGDVRFAYSTHEETDWETKLSLGDGDRAYRYARTSRSYKKGASVMTALQEAAGSMGLKLDPSVTASTTLQAQFATGRTLQGPTRDELTRLLAPFGYHWSIQDGRLQILKDQNASPTSAYDVSQSTGMIGSPEWTTPEKSGASSRLKVKMLLFPELIPGGTIHVSSEAIEGLFRLNKVEHTGDTHGDDWMTEVEAVPRTGSVVQS